MSGVFHNMFNPGVWAAVPFHFWSVVFFVLGSIVGSFLNVCVHRLPLGESIVRPPSHCPHCGYHIPWYLNIPLVTWVFLRGKCANCGAPISIRYFLVELLTAGLFLSSWLAVGPESPLLALVYCLLLAGFVVATFIDFAHFIIPDEITVGGMVAGFLCSLAVPGLHGVSSATTAMGRSVVGMLVGAGLIYAILRGAKVFFGRQRCELAPDSKIEFGETSLKLPDREILYEELFYRKSDAVQLQAKSVQWAERSLENVPVSLRPDALQIGTETFDPDTIPHLEVVTSEIILPREAMGLGDVKFMGAIGAFLGWQAVLFSLMLSSIIGAVVGVALIAVKRGSSRMPYGPYIAMAATVWMFSGKKILAWWLHLG